MREIPDTSNFYSSLQTTNSLHWVADFFRNVGWSVYEPDDRLDFLEVCCDWAELIIESDEPILVHGPVAEVETNAERILAIVEKTGVPFIAEIYGPGDALLRSWKSAGKK